MPNPRFLTKPARRAEYRAATTVVTAKGCADCSLQKGPACADCIHHALRGFGLIHWTPIVRH